MTPEARGRIARQVHGLRKKAGLTRAALAGRVGTTATILRLLEGDDREGQSLELLQRIAHALGRRADIRLISSKARRKPA